MKLLTGGVARLLFTCAWTADLFLLNLASLQRLLLRNRWLMHLAETAKERVSGNYSLYKMNSYFLASLMYSWLVGPSVFELGAKPSVSMASLYSPVVVMSALSLAAGHPVSLFVCLQHCIAISKEFKACVLFSPLVFRIQYLHWWVVLYVMTLTRYCNALWENTHKWKLPLKGQCVLLL